MAHGPLARRGIGTVRAVTATKDVSDPASVSSADADQWREVTEWKERISDDGNPLLSPCLLYTSDAADE